MIVLADHGDEFFEHGQLGHGLNLYNETVKVPLIICPPQSPTSKLKDCNKIVSTLDILPTIIKLAGIDYDLSSFQGISLVDGEVDNPRTHFMSIVNRKDKNLWWAIVAEPYKMIIVNDVEGNNISNFLFNLEDDPEEKLNIYGIDQKLCNRLEKILRIQIEKTVEYYEPESFKKKLKDKERLKAMGYTK